jgi:hypothetical protein
MADLTDAQEAALEQLASVFGGHVLVATPGKVKMRSDDENGAKILLVCLCVDCDPECELEEERDDG